MGMFDYLKCKYPLPDASDNDLEYQTKDTPAQFLDNYEIRADGSLWHLDYDIDKVCVTERSFGITDWPTLTWKSGSSITMLFSIVRGMTSGWIMRRRRWDWRS